MKSVRLLTYDLSMPTNGQARFARVLSLALRKIGLEVSVRGLWASAATLGTLTSRGVSAGAVRIGEPSEFQWSRDILMPKEMLRSLATYAARDPPCDWTIVLSDELVGIASYLHGGQPVAYISNGDFFVLFFDDAFFGDRRVMKSLASVLVSSRIRRHAREVRGYDLLLGNSNFTRDLMSFLYGIPFVGVCYPPVDFDQFKPSAPKASPPFALTVARNLHEPGVTTLEELAREVPLKVVGGLRVKGADSVGVVDDRSLAALYSEASVVIAPKVSELFGYSIAESLACGTPVVCYSVCGPGELVRTGVNGWVVDSPDQMVSTVARILRERSALPSADEVRKSAVGCRDIEVATRLRDLMTRRS